MIRDEIVNRPLQSMTPSGQYIVDIPNKPHYIGTEYLVQAQGTQYVVRASR